MTNSIKSIAEKIETLKKRVDDCIANCEPYKDDLESEFYSTILKLETKLACPVNGEQITAAETKLGCSLPAPYIELLKEIGPFAVGDHELVLLNDCQLGLNLGQLIEERVESHSLDNFKDGHYHDFIILAEYGYFPQEDMDYSSGLAFNSKNINEIISYSCDDYYLDAQQEGRRSYSKDAFKYIEECLDNLIDRLEEPIEALNEEIEFFKQQEEE